VLRVAEIHGSNGYSAGGSARIVANRGRHTLELSKDFRVDVGGVDVYLARGKTLKAGDVGVGSLQALYGAQSYPLSDNGAAFHYVLLWCRAFVLPIAVGEFR
jgi:hypothetical protein